MRLAFKFGALLMPLLCDRIFLQSSSDLVLNFRLARSVGGKVKQQVEGLSECQPFGLGVVRGAFEGRVSAA